METGKHYNYFRDFDASLGRYIQSDPIGLAANANTYGYVEANPLAFADPKGLRPSPGAELDPAYRWQPQPGDSSPGPAPDGTCLVLCVVLKTAFGMGAGSAIGGFGNFLQGVGGGASRVAGAAMSFGSAAAKTPAGQVIGAGLTMKSCEYLCRPQPICPIPEWAKGYQNMPLNSPFQSRMWR